MGGRLHWQACNIPESRKTNNNRIRSESAAARRTGEYLVEFPDLVRRYQSALSDRLRYVSSCSSGLAVPEALYFNWTMVQPGLVPTVPPHPASSVVVISGYASSMQGLLVIVMQRLPFSLSPWLGYSGIFPSGPLVLRGPIENAIGPSALR